jgi:uncharacterized membrane protein
MDEQAPRPRRVFSVGRVEAFSDGVLAVAITLLVLDLHLDAAKGSIADQLGSTWPSYAAYLVSFFVIGVVWVNHHALFARASGADRVILFYNLMLLMFVTLIPFTTSTLAGYLRAGGSDERLAVVFYGAATEGMAIAFTLILRHLVHHGLVRTQATPEQARQAVRRFGVGSLIYPVITLIGLISPVAMLVCYAALTGFYMFDQTPVLAGES